MTNGLERRMQSYREYFDTSKATVEWIIGLTIGELALIISQRLYTDKLIFGVMVFFSGLSILFAISIMYCVMRAADLKMYSAALRTTNPELRKNEYNNEIDKRYSKFSNWLFGFVAVHKIYNWLFISFGLGTLSMIGLVIKEILFGEKVP